MTTKKQRIIRLIRHTTLKIFLFSIILGTISYLVNFAGFTNEMAMMQFENDNYSYAVLHGVQVRKKLVYQPEKN